MPHGQPHFGTEIEAQLPIPKSSEQLECESKGGTWNLINQTCTPKPPPVPKELEGLTLKTDEPKPEPTSAGPSGPEFFRDAGTGEITGVKLSDGRVFFGNAETINEIIRRENEKTAAPEGALPVGTARRQERQRELGLELSQQVGQIDPSTGITPTNLSQDEALRQGIVNSIPSAIRLAGQFGVGAAALGAAASAPAGGIAALPAAAIGASVGFVSGITGGIISNMASQRTDNTNAQQRVLDEGKQTLMDWVTLSRADPANAQFYLSQFNRQLQLIQDAHVQMLTDTNADLAKFENAVPNLAEFSTFYSVGGERDALLNEMTNALLTPSDVNYELLALIDRRK